MGNRNNVTCGCETCISAMLLQSDLNKLRLKMLTQVDTFYINAASTRLSQRSNKYYIQYKDQDFTKKSQIHFRASDDVSSYHCTFPFS